MLLKGTLDDSIENGRRYRGTLSVNCGIIMVHLQAFVHIPWNFYFLTTFSHFRYASTIQLHSYNGISAVNGKK